MIIGAYHSSSHYIWNTAEQIGSSFERYELLITSLSQIHLYIEHFHGYYIFISVKLAPYFPSF